MLEKIFLTFIFLSFVECDTCTWDNCPKWSNDPHMKYIHLVPHTHDDMGWKQTADDLYMTKVQYIINTVIEELKRDPTKRFCYAETGFLTRWLEDQPDSRVQDFRTLVQNGQMELVGGGWVQADEGSTHYINLIDMYTLGLGKLKKYFGEQCGMPKINWQLDPFGHSREHANLAVMMGYEALYFAREHINEHIERVFGRKLEFDWKVSDDLDNTIQAGCLMFSYESIDFMCYDQNCDDNPPIQDNPNLEGYNLDDKMFWFYAFADVMFSFVPHNHILMPMGGDFRYVNADMWFANIDKYIKHANLDTPKTNITAFYSTPSCYVKAMRESMASLNMTFPNRSYDFFPYASQDNFHSYWTGYFTSRPAFKRFVREYSAFLQVVRLMEAFASLNQPDSSSPLEKLERALGLAQHHDVITGTDNEMVNQNNIYRISQGIDDAEKVLSDAMQNISANFKDDGSMLPKQVLCRNLNESECLFIENGMNTTVTVYNANSHPMSSLIQVPLYDDIYDISMYDSEGMPVNFSVIPVYKNTNFIQINNNNSADFEIRFMAEVDTIGFRSYFIVFGLEKGSTSIKNVYHTKVDDRTISNELISLHFDTDGHLFSYYDKIENKTYALSQDFMYYTGANDSMGQASGPYVFRPIGNATSVVGQNPISIDVIKGPFYEEVHQTFAPWITQIVRLVQGKPYVEFEWTVGPVEIDVDQNGKKMSKEVITRYMAKDFKTNNTFFTDSNGRQMMKRVKDYQPDYPYLNTEPVAANYFPVNSRIMVSDYRDMKVDMAVMTDRSEGGSSLQDGEIELLIHRRLFYDDGEGADQVLDEPGRDGRGLVIRGKHWLYISPTQNSSRLHRPLAYEMFHQPTITFSTFGSIDDYRNSYVTKFSGISTPLPSNVQLITLKRFTPNSFLIRIEHIYQKNEDPTLSQPAMVDLQKLLTGFKIIDVVELNLAANIQKASIKNTTITLNPMEIRTFEFFTSPKQNDASSTTLTSQKSSESTTTHPTKAATMPQSSGNTALRALPSLTAIGMLMFTFI